MTPSSRPLSLLGATPTEDTGMIDGRSWKSRALLAAIAMLGAWLFSAFLLLVLALTLQPSLQLPLLIGASGLVALVSLVLFAAPLTAAIPAHLQLRGAPLLVLSALLWTTCLYHVFFREWPWSAFRAPSLPGLFFPCWTLGFTLTAVILYMVLLRRGSHLLGSVPESEHAD